MTSHLPHSWASLPALATVLDADRLTDLFGGELGGCLRTSRLRYKPGVSAVARVDVEPTGAVHWVAAFAPSGNGRDRLDRIAARTDLDGGTGPVLVADLPDRSGQRLGVGPIGADPDLGRPLAGLGEDLARGLGRPGSDIRLLRYNPRRRAVFAGTADDGGHLVTKLTAGPAPADPHLLARLAAGGLPVLAPVAFPAARPSPHVLHYPWFGTGDLAVRAAAGERAVEGVAAAAGAALARLHVHGSSLAGPARTGAPLAPARKLAALAADLAALDPALAERCARAGRAAAEAVAARGRAPDRLLHGDFSADQVLVDRSRGPGTPQLRLADLDRVRWGAAADDLGCFVAVEILGAGGADRPAAPEDLPLSAALLGGYSSEAAVPDPAEVMAWAAVHVLARSMEPFRSTAPGWRESTGARLALAEQLVARALRSPAVAGPVAVAAPLPGVVAEPGSGAAAEPDAGGSGNPVPEAVLDADGSRLRVRRAWPAADARLVLELEDGRGRVRAGESVPGVGGGRTVRVLSYGEDPHLPGLAAGAGAGRVVVHRHRRRAVVETPDCFVKFFARGRAGRAAEVSERLHHLGRAAGFAVPAVLGRAEDRVEFSVLPGRSLHELGAAGRERDYRAAWAQWSACWPVLASAVPPDGELPEHTPEEEARALARWAERLEDFPGLLDAPPGAVAALAERIGEDLGAVPGHRRIRALLHRDLHDKQLLFDGERLGLLDFDTAAIGEPELDLANLAVHLDLRAAQGLLGPRLRAAGREAIDAVARASAADSARLAVHAESSRLRLACVYAFRPRWRGVAQGLLDGLRC